MTNIAIVLCTYNGESFLEQQLISLESQVYKNIHLLIYDWGSSDATISIINNFKLRSNLKISIFQLGPPLGPYLSFKRALAHALDFDPSLDLFALCDQDDIWHPDKLLVAVSAYESYYSQVFTFFSDVSLIDSAGALVQKSRSSASPYINKMPLPINGQIFFVNPAVGMSCVFSREVVDCFVQLPDNDQIMHDWSLMIVAYLLNSEFCYSSQPLVSYRQHSSNLVGSSSSLGILGLIRLLVSRFGQCFRQYDMFVSTNLFALNPPFLSFFNLKCFLEDGFITPAYRFVWVLIFSFLGFMYLIQCSLMSLRRFVSRVSLPCL